MNQLLAAIRDLKQSNTEFRNELDKKVSGLEQKVDQKHIPINLELGILTTLQTSMDKAIKDLLSSDYNSPLKKLVEKVINDHSTQLLQIMSEAFAVAISTDNFKESVRSAFAHKVARHVLSNTEGCLIVPRIL